jgi:hypothetical protein
MEADSSPYGPISRLCPSCRQKYRPGAGVLNGTELRSRTLCSGKTSITKRFRKGTEKVLMKVPPAPDPIGHPGALAFLMVGDFKFAA